ncbi:hypothetical protein HGRIS_013954 [Hohenbuehelia grisea]|uniref:Major facilitator superfamily (MFS) profile domain-containing protein n=1 Tax=Hohenbuehelia grisea TaxID=104357 RepID=A0ABR3JSJ6_9AGAR
MTRQYGRPVGVLGYSRPTGSLFLAINSALNIVSRISMGVLADRIGRQNMTIATGSPSVSECVILSTIRPRTGHPIRSVNLVFLPARSSPRLFGLVPRKTMSIRSLSKARQAHPPTPKAFWELRT